MRSLHCAGLAALLLAGCGEQHFRAETVWHADGRVERAVYQPAEFFPADSRKGWEVIRPADGVSSEVFSGSIRDQPSASGDASYLAAWGTFLSPEVLPEHVRFSGPDGRSGRLERSAEVRRLGLVTEYAWRERLTDVVSLTDMRAARRESIALIADLVESMLRDGTLKYDISRLLRWLRTEAADWFDELHVTFVEAAARRELDRDGRALAVRLADICRKHGLDLRGTDGELVINEESSDRLHQFLIAKTRETVRTPSGERIDEAEAGQILDKLGLHWEGSSYSWQPSEESKRVVAARFGGEERAKAKAEELTTRLLGVYQAGILSPRRPFRFEINVPGTIVETTGEQIAANRAAWRFDAKDAFPFGYEMRVRSLAPNEAGQKAVLGGVRLKSREQLAEYATLLKDPSLADVMEKCVAAGSRKPFEDYAAEIKAKEGIDPATLARLDRLSKLLSP